MAFEPRTPLPGVGPDTGILATIVAAAFTLRPEAIRRVSRGPARAAFARQVAMYLAHTRLGLSFTAAGLAFGRDRTTAAHACRRVEDRREDRRIDATLDCLERAVDTWLALSGRPGSRR